MQKILVECEGAPSTSVVLLHLTQLVAEPLLLYVPGSVTSTVLYLFRTASRRATEITTSLLSSYVEAGRLCLVSRLGKKVAHSASFGLLASAARSHGSFSIAMAPRTTRGAAAKEAALSAAAEKPNKPHQLSSPPPKPVIAKSTKISKASTAKTSGKSAKKAPATKGSKSEANAAKSTKPDASNDEALGLSKIENPATEDALPTSAKSSRKRKRTATLKVEADPDELPHGLGRIKRVAKVKPEEVNDDIDPPVTKPEPETVTLTKKDVKDIEETIDTTIAASSLAAEESPTKRTRRSKKANPYGVTLGESPYPDLLRPTPEECQKVDGILSKKHGGVAKPDSIPLPSLTVAGCGEVPCVLEALLRTLLSAHTSNGNAALAVQGLIKRFGVLKSGMSQGCLDWNAARLAGREEIEIAIKRGGLAQSKSKYIIGILNMVYEENQARRAALAAKVGQAKSAGKEHTIDPNTDTVDPDHAEAEAIEKASEVMLADTSALTLDYVHAMSANAAFAKLITFPGIGVKTASCTLLFCMQRPSFAVDTHVFRLCKWLGWVPQNATRDTTFAHCDVRVPDELKYSLHQLLIKHGKECGRCRAITGESSEAWEEGCVIDELVKRTGKKKGGTVVAKVGKGKKVAEADEDEGSGSEVHKAKGKKAAKKVTEATDVYEMSGNEAKKARGKKARGANTKGEAAPANAKANGKAKSKQQGKGRKATKPTDSEVDEDEGEEEADDGSEYDGE